jgi:hypothetical protein
MAIPVVNRYRHFFLSVLDAAVCDRMRTAIAQQVQPVQQTHQVQQAHQTSQQSSAPMANNQRQRKRLACGFSAHTSQ